MEQYGTDVMEERYGLAMERIGQIEKEQAVPAPYGEYFRETAGFLLLMGQVRELLRSGAGDELTWNSGRSGTGGFMRIFCRKTMGKAMETPFWRKENWESLSESCCVFCMRSWRGAGRLCV